MGWDEEREVFCKRAAFLYDSSARIQEGALGVVDTEGVSRKWLFACSLLQ